ncbi:primosomal protein N' [Afifella sp. H1R]|uniref:primosomal protein N' n=1 Tax=Afifella sp. H1R TaxID=2908841 RepID=UPI001F353CB8|nr:primosomal protein N' [Afifella sp. H1R]MCF1505195.1 primosomal protein N' [Afifella sp. H1R]
MPDTFPLQVLLPYALERSYTYLADRPLEPGTIVVVPLGPREVLGVVWDDEPPQTLNAARLKPIAAVLPALPLPRPLMRLIDFVADYTLSPPGMVLRMALRVTAALSPEKPVPAVRVTGMAPDRSTAARQRVLDLAGDGLAWSKSGLATAAGVSASVVDGLVKQGALEMVLLPPRPVTRSPVPDFAPPELSGAQAEAGAQLRALVRDEAFSVALIDGVTGAGKTEVFFEAAAEAFEKGRQVLILMPEIALTSQALERFAGRFGTPPAEWHSEMSPKLRERVWRGVADGTVRAVVGARSALFLPFCELGLIVVDEEHDGAYKQEEGVIYHARDMAVAYGHLAHFPVVLSSATPSVESRVNAQRGRYRHIHLDQRYSGAGLPDVDVVDLREAPPERGRSLSPKLVEAVRQTLAQGHQALLFLNRRGYAPLTLCRHCGHRFTCPNCSTWLVEHRFRGVLACHHCGHEERRPEACPACGAEDSLVACGPGVERLQEEALDLFPEARSLVLSSDLAGGVQRLRLELAAVEKGEADIIIGTQLVAKGHNFPNLTLVGVVDADLGLAQGDPRAAERTFQLLTQVAGRAGRAGQSSRAFLQTWQPGHPVMTALAGGQPEAFFEAEVESRRRGALPPFSRLAGIIVSGPERAAAQEHARAMARAAPREEGVELLGPAEAPLALIRGRYRFRLLARAGSSNQLHRWLRAWLAAAPKARGNLRVAVDVDPQSFL